jgi:hypothetical protein
MSNAILNSNASSALIASMGQVSSTKNPYIYSFSQKGTLSACNVPSHSRTVVVSAPTTSIAFGQNIDFGVIRAGMWDLGFLKMVVKNNSTAACAISHAAMNLYVEEIQLLTAGKVITSNKPFYRACVMSSKPYTIKKNLEDCYALVGNGDKKVLAIVAEQTAYIPLSFSHFDFPEAAINSSFVESLTIRVRLAQANAFCDDNATNGGAAVNLSLQSLELVQVHRLLPSDLEQKQISQNYSDTDSLVSVQFDAVEESTTKNPAAAAVSQVFKHEINTNRTIRKLYFALEDTGVANATSIAANNGPGKYLELSKIALRANGQVIFDIDAPMLQKCFLQDVDSANSPYACGNGFDGAVAHTKNIYEWDFGSGRDMSHITNQISARELSNFEVTVTSSSTAALSDRPYNLRVCAISSQLQSVSSASGKISTSLSS